MSVNFTLNARFLLIEFLDIDLKGFLILV